jgi:alpha-aminoadipate/glutamate carrier protein LysW
MVNCPNCDAVIDVDEEELDEGDTLTCDECGADLSVTGLSPLELETQEDEDEEEEEEEEDDFDYDEDETEDEDEEEEKEEDWH